MSKVLGSDRSHAGARTTRQAPTRKIKPVELERLRAEQAAVRMDPKARKSAGGWMIRCPAHEDTTPSLSIHDKADGGLLLHCHAGCDFDAVRTKFEALGIAVAQAEAVKPDSSGNVASLLSRGWRVVAIYSYRDPEGAVSYENVRLEILAHGCLHKTFRQRRPTTEGRYAENLDGITRIPYRLPELLQQPADDVHITEGEKDAGTLVDKGLLATSITHAGTTDLSALRNRNVFIHEDNDHAGREKARKLAEELVDAAVSVRIVRYVDAGEHGDVTDWINSGHTRQDLLARCQMAPVFSKATKTKTSTPDWPEIAQTGAPRARSQLNIRAYLDWAGIVLTHDNLTWRSSVKIDGETTELSDAIMRRLRLEADALGLSPPKDFFDDVLLDLARQNSVHPIREYLEALVWDGQPRLDQLLAKYFGAEDTPLHAAFGRKHLIAAVRRIRRPGAKHDACLIIEGEQGTGKSSAIRILAGSEYFTDSLSIGQDAKGVIEQTNGAWLVEIAELSGIRRSEVEQVKTMITRQSDRARGAYEKFVSERPRQFVLFGTVNESQYLRDATGNRRFWPVRAGRIDIDGLSADRDQIWAEAAAYEAREETNQLPEEMWVEARRIQEERRVMDPWQETLTPLLDGLIGCLAMDTLWSRLGIQAHNQDGNLGQRLTIVMKALGFKKSRRRRNGKPIYCYENTDETRWLAL